MDAFYSVAAFLFLCGLAFFGLIRSPNVMRFVAHIAVTPQAIEKVRRGMADASNDFDLGTMSPDDGEEHINQICRHAIGKTLAEINPKNPIEVNDHWPPDQKVTIVGDICVIAPNIGWLIMGPHSRIEPITVRVKRAGVVNLDNRKPLKSVHDAIYEPPAKAAVNARPAPPTASKPPQKPSPAAKPTPVRK